MSLAFRAEYAFSAKMFADLVDTDAVWECALEGWDMTESPTILEFIAEGEFKGRTDERVERILRLLQIRFPPGVPVDLATLIRKTTDLEKLALWFDLAATASSLEDFRKAVTS